MIRCIVIDDEPIAIRALMALLQSVPDVEIIAASSDAVEAWHLIRERSPDLVFLDIEMPQFTGVDLIKALEAPPCFIFTTAYREYAAEGFDLNAVDYLLKPISLPRMLKALDKYRRLVSAPAQDPGTEMRSIQVRVDRKTIMLSTREILFVESAGDYVKIYTDGKVYLSKSTITEMEESLPREEFVRIHRSFLVSVRQVRAYTSRTIEVGEKVLPVSRTYREQAMKRLKDVRSKT